MNTSDQLTADFNKEVMKNNIIKEFKEWRLKMVGGATNHWPDRA